MVAYISPFYPDPVQHLGNKPLQDGKNQIAFYKEILRGRALAAPGVLEGTPVNPPAQQLYRSVNNDEENTSIDPMILALFSQYGNENQLSSNESLKVQQLHDLAILQRDAELLQQVNIVERNLRLEEGASTVDLSETAQNIVDGTEPSNQEIAIVADIIQPLVDVPLTPIVLRNIQNRIESGNHHIDLSLKTLSLAMGYIAGMQESPYHTTDNIPAKIEKRAVAPVVSSSKDSALH